MDGSGVWNIDSVRLDARAVWKELVKATLVLAHTLILMRHPGVVVGVGIRTRVEMLVVSGWKHTVAMGVRVLEATAI